MPDPTTRERLKNLLLSANDLKTLTDWPDAIIEDYLNIFDNLITISDLLDNEIDTKIEEIETDFTSGSIPFAEDGFLIDDNTHLSWDNLNNILTALNLLSESITLSSATASRLLATNADKELESIANLAAWIAGTANQILITNDGDGTVTISIPDTDVTGTELETLSDDSMADDLHRHSELSASDGDPDACVQVDASGNVGIGTSTPATSAKLEIDSTTGALLLPRMTTAQRDALTAVNGMILYNSTLNKVQVYEGGAWASVI